MNRLRIAAVCTVLQLLVALIDGSYRSVEEAEEDWWESASLYQIYPRSFYDGVPNGVGDLKGISLKLAHLKEIGITATWLSPIFESPMADFGYDVSNFTAVDPVFGTLEDFRGMIATAKALGIKVILDFVPNHSSDECDWFRKSVERASGYEDYYIWHPGKIVNNDTREPPSNWVSVFGGSQWTWNERRQQYFLHQFLEKQPDLNYSNPAVRQEMLAVLKYWLDEGVDGFRIDAVPHIFELQHANGSYPDEPVSGWSSDPNTYEYHQHIYTKDQPATVELLYEWRSFLDEYRRRNGGDTRILIAEAYSSIETLSEYFGNGTHSGAQLPMNFNLMYLHGLSTAHDIQGSIDYWMGTMWRDHQTANWVIGNHDNSRVATRMGRHKADHMNLLVAFLPGASVTYYGEEIGMENVPTECTEVSCDGRDPERTPMQWSPATNAGFSQNATTWLPIADNYRTYNVQTERGVARSHLQLFKRVHALKKTKAFRAFKQPDGFAYGPLGQQVFQVIRRNGPGEQYRLLLNMGNALEWVDGQLDAHTMDCVIVNAHSPRRIGDKIELRRRFSLGPFEAVVLRWLPL